jgi:hypothetical protein
MAASGVLPVSLALVGTGAGSMAQEVRGRPLIREERWRNGT